LSLEIEGVKTDVVVVVVVVVVDVASVVVVELEVESMLGGGGLVDPVVSVDVGELEDVSVDVASVDVAVLSVPPVIPDTIPMAPEASIPAQSSAPNPRTIPARRSVFRPFISPASLLPR
jgi:hypothetical protein